MPESPLKEIGSLALAYGLVAAAAIPLWFLLRKFASDHDRRFFCRPHTIEVAIFALLAFALPGYAAFFAPQFLPGSMPKGDLQSLAIIAACVVWVAMAGVWWLAARGPELHWPSRQRLAGDAAAGLAAFLILTPLTFAFYFAAVGVLEFFGGKADEHPLVRFDPASGLSVGLVIAGACVAGPIFEELVLRGLLLPWARGRRYRPWILFTFALLLLFDSVRTGHALGKMIFFIDLTALMVLAAFGREIWRKWPTRTAAAIFSTSAIFGCIHMAVWPTPYPLTLLGLGLGILAIRRGSARPAIVAHALFNAVSVVFLLRRGA